VILPYSTLSKAFGIKTCNEMSKVSSNDCKPKMKIENWRKGKAKRGISNISMK